jgi:hypothetical protein
MEPEHAVMLLILPLCAFANTLYRAHRCLNTILSKVYLLSSALFMLILGFMQIMKFCPFETGILVVLLSKPAKEFELPKE